MSSRVLYVRPVYDIRPRDQLYPLHFLVVFSCVDYGTVELNIAAITALSKMTDPYSFSCQGLKGRGGERGGGGERKRLEAG